MNMTLHELLELQQYHDILESYVANMETHVEIKDGQTGELSFVLKALEGKRKK